MFFDSKLRKMSNECKLKAMEMELKYQQTGNEFYKILAKAYEDETDCYKRFQITKEINKKENPAAEKQTENDLELRLSPTIIIQNGGLECIIEFEDRDFKFEFEQPISHVVQLAKTEKGCHKKENN